MPPERRQLFRLSDRFISAVRNIQSMAAKPEPLAEKFYNEILQIQYGLKEDPFGWRVKILDGKKN